MSEDFHVSIKLIDLDGSTLIFDMTDHAGGFWSVEHTPPNEDMDLATEESFAVNGEFETSGRALADRYVVLLRVEGSSWAQVNGRVQALRTAYKSQTHYLLRETIEGVVTTYRARRPNLTPATVKPINIANGFVRVLLSFPVQPNPTVTGTVA